MPHRHVPSLLLLLVRHGLALFFGMALVSPALAQSDDRPTLLSFLMSRSLVDETPTVEPRLDNELVVQELRPMPELPGQVDLTTPYDNLWDRIRNGFAMTNLNDDLTLHYQQYYQNRPEALRQMVERARPFLHHIVDELEARGMPTELALLPMVESAFNPQAYSRAHASGLWQFIPATGKRFNLDQNWWQDQRRDIVASTSAALDYLQAIYEMQGDWHLALASYNWGEGAVKRAVERNNAQGQPTDYANLRMPAETRNYVPKLQALKNIFANPGLMASLGIPNIPNRPYFAMLESPRPMDVKTAARLANISLEEFQRLNPSHNRPIIKPDSPVVIPADRLDLFHKNLRNNTAPLSEWRGYTVQSSERLNEIAARHGISSGELARINGLPERARLGAGSTLLVPGGGEALNNLLSASAPTHIIEPEFRPCGKQASRKGGKKVTKMCPVGESHVASKNRRDEDAAPSGKTARGKHADKTTTARHEAMPSGKRSAPSLASKEPTRSNAKSASTSTKNHSEKVAGKAPAKSGAPAKVAKSGNGRRG